MTPYDFQVEIADQAYDILKQYGLVYLAMEERCGKSLTSILVCERSASTKILILTKKKALGGWYETLQGYSGRGPLPGASETLRTYSVSGTDFTVTNYHGAVKLKADYGIVILDEAHSYLSKFPKVGKIWKDVYKLTKNKPLLYLSATSHAQGYQLLYNQLRLSSWSPWLSFKNFYDFHRSWGIPDKTRTPYGLIETYKKVRPEVFDTIQHLFITKTRRELDFEHEPEDHLRYVELSPETKALYNSCMKKEMLLVPSKGIESPLDSPMKLRTTLHMIEGGAAKVEGTYYTLDNKEKINAIQSDFGDTKDLCIMYNYIAEGEKLRKEFKLAKILQGTSFAEGVDLSGVEHLVVYSQDFSTARHSQRRARQANKKRDTPIDVTFYLVKEGVSEQVYNTVSKNKTNFIDKLFERNEL